MKSIDALGSSTREPFARGHRLPAVESWREPHLVTGLPQAMSCLLAGPPITPADAIFVTQYDTAGDLRDVRATKHGYIMANDQLTTSKGALVSTEQGRIFGGVESPASGGACVPCQSPSSRRNITSLTAESFPRSAARFAGTNAGRDAISRQIQPRLDIAF